MNQLPGELGPSMRASLPLWEERGWFFERNWAVKKTASREVGAQGKEVLLGGDGVDPSG